jgi:hypothetical protein
MAMDERRLYRELMVWLRSNHPRVLAQWESERRLREGQRSGDTTPMLPPSSHASRSDLDGLAPDASVSDVTRVLQRELESIGISGGMPGVTSDGTPCIHLIKQGVYGSAYEENVTLARLRDAGYRRHLRQVFG